MRIVFWQNLLAFYQEPHIRALSAMGHEVIWVSQEDINEERKAQGWSLPNCENLEVHVAPDDAKIERLINESPEKSVHIFSGIHGFPTVTKAFMLCLKTKARMGMLIENRDDQGLKGKGRLLQYRLDSIKYGSRISFIFVMGYTGAHGGRHWYRRSGFQDKVLYPYGYFVGGPSEISLPSPNATGPVQLMFLGQLVTRKAVDVLLNACATLKDLDYHLTVIGDGPEKQALPELAASLGVTDKTTFIPYLKNAEAMAKMATADVFILPSRFDGWGVVINEALLRGVPVVCSDRCGAQDLLQEDWRGSVFKSENPADLARVLRARIAQGRNTPERASRLLEWGKCISGETAARYMVECLANAEGNGPRPKAPWLSG